MDGRKYPKSTQRGRSWHERGVSKIVLDDEGLPETFTNYQHQASDPESLSHNVVWSILEDRKHNTWIGTEDGLNRVVQRDNTSSLSFEHYRHQEGNPQSISHNSVKKILEDVNGNLWLGTFGGGLNKFDYESGVFTNYQHQTDNPQSLSENKILSIYEDTNGILWIGTHGGGLNRFDTKSEIFTSYRKEDGLPNDVVYGILKDGNGDLWLSTNNGVSKFDPVKKHFTNYDKKDGLQGNEFNTGAYYTDRSGRMFFGGIEGYSEFYPEAIKNTNYNPEVAITNLLLFNRPVKVAKTDFESNGFLLPEHINYTREITLNYTDYIFAFEFSTLNFRQLDKNQFLYQLEGFDEEWVSTSYLHRRATYTNLPPRRIYV